MRSTQRGFTLVELCTTLAVAGILLGTATWQMQQAIVGQRVGAAARRLLMDFRGAPAVAARRNAPVQVTVDPADAACGGGPGYRLVAKGVGGGADAELERVCIANDYPGVILATDATAPLTCEADTGPSLPGCSLCGSPKTITFYPSGEVDTPTAGEPGDSVVFASRDFAGERIAVGLREFSGRTRVYTGAAGQPWRCP